MARAATMPAAYQAPGIRLAPDARARVRPPLLIPIALAASLLVHVAGLAALSITDLRAPRAARVTDAPGSERIAPTLLAMDAVAAPAPPAPVTPPAPQPPPSPPPPRFEQLASTSPSPLDTPEPEAPASTPAPPAPTAILPQARPVDPPPTPPPAAEVAPAPLPVTFAGSADATRARDVIYVLDASGAMVTTLAFAKAELQRSINRLEESQRFQVIIARRFADSATLDRYPARPQAATPAAKAKVGTFLDSIQAGGKAAPLDALRDALSHKPDLVLLLTANFRRSGPASTDPWHSDAVPSIQLRREVAADIAPTLAELDALNPVRDSVLSSAPAQRVSVIKAVQFVDEDPTGLLPQIAQRHGDGLGSYRVLTLDEIARLEGKPR